MLSSRHPPSSTPGQGIRFAVVFTGRAFPTIELLSLWLGALITGFHYDLRHLQWLWGTNDRHPFTLQKIYRQCPLVVCCHIIVTYGFIRLLYTCKSFWRHSSKTSTKAKTSGPFHSTQTSSTWFTEYRVVQCDIRCTKLSASDKTRHKIGIKHTQKTLAKRHVDSTEAGQDKRLPNERMER